ncbi:MAG: hypothetical protein M0R77_09850 [Gammaproteobacteria bacterium]|nr:hypothetical protein [Gammaproteobacteria bacterium]
MSVKSLTGRIFGQRRQHPARETPTKVIRGCSAHHEQIACCCSPSFSTAYADENGGISMCRDKRWLNQRFLAEARRTDGASEYFSNRQNPQNFILFVFFFGEEHQ